MLIVFLSLDISLVQDDEVGDGTTSVTVLACELLKVAACSVMVFIVLARRRSNLLVPRYTHRL